ncbi:MAG: histidinol-phosphate transaminase [Gammaproteobacteria bacterium]|nr:histidinol-phosphate transaminase [Gammaproteobacteria bacterium]
MNDVLKLLREDIRDLKAYVPEEASDAGVKLDANELPWRLPGDNSKRGLNRYPDSQSRELTELLASLYKVSPDALLVTRGSDDAIDLLIRAFCRAEHDSVLVCPPTFSMYSVAAHIQGAQVVELPLDINDGFALSADGIIDSWAPGLKVVFLCSPNNPTGNVIPTEVIESILSALRNKAVVVVDEAYIEFTQSRSCISLLDEFDNLIVLRTLSKAYGLAGARCGVMVARPEILQVMRRILPPYPLPTPTIEAVIAVLAEGGGNKSQECISLIAAERERVVSALILSPYIRRVWPPEANFVLAETVDKPKLLDLFAGDNLIVRNIECVGGLENCIRISIGTPDENDILIDIISGTRREKAQATVY